MVEHADTVFCQMLHSRFRLPVTSVLKAFYSDHFVLPLPPGHRFPMQKYRMLRDRAASVAAGLEFHEAPTTPDGVLALAHHPDYIRRVQTGLLTSAEQKRIGFPWSLEMAERSRRATGATISACRAAFQDGVAVNLAGGTHHAHADHGEGFCVFNDSAIAARLMQAERRASRVAVIDLDVHQGNGTASILQHDDSVFTLSLHGELNYPFAKAVSDLDIGLVDGTSDEAYLAALDGALEQVFAQFAPQLIIFLAGADPHEGDRLGRLKLSFNGMARRDRMVLERADSYQVPVAVTMAGGYGTDIATTVAVHLQTISIAAEFAARWQVRHSDAHPA